MTTTETKPVTDPTWTEADHAWGYKFGCEGLRRHVDAAEFLGVSRHTLYRLIEANKVRAGVGGKICFKSISDYSHSQEA